MAIESGILKDPGWRHMTMIDAPPETKTEAPASAVKLGGAPSVGEKQGRGGVVVRLLGVERHTGRTEFLSDLTFIDPRRLLLNCDVPCRTQIGTEAGDIELAPTHHARIEGAFVGPLHR